MRRSQQEGQQQPGPADRWLLSESLSLSRDSVNRRRPIDGESASAGCKMPGCCIDDDHSLSTIMMMRFRYLFLPFAWVGYRTHL
jgi:hypothetical protein